MANTLDLSCNGDVGFIDWLRLAAIFFTRFSPHNTYSMSRGWKKAARGPSVNRT
jgi:hypothetical protein